MENAMEWFALKRQEEKHYKRSSKRAPIGSSLLKKEISRSLPTVEFMKRQASSRVSSLVGKSTPHRLPSSVEKQSAGMDTFLDDEREIGVEGQDFVVYQQALSDLSEAEDIQEQEGPPFTSPNPMETSFCGSEIYYTPFAFKKQLGWSATTPSPFPSVPSYPVHTEEVASFPPPSQVTSPFPHETLPVSLLPPSTRASTPLRGTLLTRSSPPPFTNEISSSLSQAVSVNPFLSHEGPKTSNSASLRRHTYLKESLREARSHEEDSLSSLKHLSTLPLREKDPLFSSVERIEGAPTYARRAEPYETLPLGEGNSSPAFLPQMKILSEISPKPASNSSQRGKHTLDAEELAEGQPPSADTVGLQNDPPALTFRSSPLAATSTTSVSRWPQLLSPRDAPIDSRFSENSRPFVKEDKMPPFLQYSSEHRHLLEKIACLPNPVTLKNERLTQHLRVCRSIQPHLFLSVELWYRMRLLMQIYRFSLPLRRFLAELFDATFRNMDALLFLDAVHASIHRKERSQ
ncbi:hypothetical protein IE077_001283 [Cardiosporidium cionae]|uniref:Uncharacterized protein n=1 Tax=Cardiosporidium cionae TaxID=476202 RepID=A0ABQ7J5P5_9APIC|nr:hypothetical protein IE077_001283 [Cardiosporidium cionae]|eukprot:KAF8819270.1 hypothetical protein IE077_001283 [Cardiosporidium cionae]